MVVVGLLVVALGLAELAVVQLSFFLAYQIHLRNLGKFGNLIKISFAIVKVSERQSWWLAGRVQLPNWAHYGNFYTIVN